MMRALMRRLTSIVLACGLLAAAPARASVSEPEPRPDDAFDFMNLLAQHGLHALDEERWNAYGQLTWISSFKLPFSAAYSNLNGTGHSLSTDFEHSFTGTATLYVGVALWRGAEIYWAPELITEQPLSGLTGLGGAIQNFELQKQGVAWPPTVYSSRLYLRQTIDLGGARLVKTSDPSQLASTTTARRFVFTLGNFSVLDFMDKNAFAGDLRREFFNMAFLTYAAWDFPADARGYTWGALGELYWDHWALRASRAIAPQRPNQLPLDFHFWQYYGDQIEIEHQHTIHKLPGAIRVLGYRNHENMARFDDAVSAYNNDHSKNAANCGDRSDYGSTNAMGPDLCWAREPNVKMGIGINLEQAISNDIGLFLRAMYSDGNTEVYSFTSADRSISLGALAHGNPWHRPRDLAGVGLGASWISTSHANYLAAGGVDGFIGDGRITPAAESVIEAFYSLSLLSSVFLSVDYQHITNPAYNADRGSVDIFGARLHAEF